MVIVLREVDHVGYTGTRHGMTERQKALIGEFLRIRRRDALVSWFHHGDCVGGDAEAHQLAWESGYKIIIHPPTNEIHRAFCNYDTMMPPYGYSGRNQRIAISVSKLFATPGMKSVGTWNCVEHATNMKVPVTIVYPNGEIENRG